MSHDAEISRRNPGYFVFLVDQSGSMAEIQGGTNGRSKAQNVADAINRIIQNIVLRCSKNEGIKDYFCISVLGYGTHVQSAFLGALAHRPYAKASELEATPARLEQRTQRVPDGAGGLAEVSTAFPIWFEPVADGGTPMCQAFREAFTLAQEWIARQPDGFPPIIMNLTDGEASDGDPTAGAARLVSLSSANGNVLLFNLHLSTQVGQPLLYPSSDAGLIDNYAKQLFSMSSALPESMLRAAATMELAMSPGSRGFVYNADIVSVIQFLDIGTRPSNALALR